MKIATGLISLIIGIIVFFQSCAVGLGGAVFADEVSSQSGSAGLFVAFLLFVAGAFAFALPKVAMIISAVAGILAILNGATSDFSDMTVWGILAFVLAILEFFAGRKPKKSAQTTPQQPTETDKHA